MTIKAGRDRAVAVHRIELDGQPVSVIVHESGVVAARSGPIGQILFQHVLPGPLQRTDCITLDGVPTLFATSERQILAHDLGADTTTVIATSPSFISALAAWRRGDQIVVAAGNIDGSVGMFTRAEDRSWSGTFTQTHQGRVVRVSLGLVSRKLTVISCSDSSTVALTPVSDRTAVTSLQINWTSENGAPDDIACTCTHHEGGHLYANGGIVPEFELVEAGRLTVAFVSGEHESAPVLAIGELPPTGEWRWPMVALLVRGRLAAVHPVHSGAQLAFVRGSTVYVGLLDMAVRRRLTHRSAFAWVPLILVSTFPVNTYLGMACVALVLTLLALNYLKASFTVRSIGLRYVATIDLHSEIVDVAFEDSGGLVVLSHRGVAAFDLEVLR
ncbi:hypothetical protein [Streptomyces phaeochromogenes]|uniref:hypothetical protein n=1 Tax=Streptomyces phaeochromogenes TaxID=1923 RepID=UPI002E0E727F|nr:hypothetical protein OG437_41155 [Streptomyces phaeochromogenes]